MFLCVLFSAVLLSAQLAAVYSRDVQPVMPFQPDMAKLLRSSRLTTEDPTKAMKCFSDYISQSNDISQKYSYDYKQCLVLSQQERSKLETEMLMEKIGLVDLSQGVCQRLTKCNKMNSTLETFKCHAENGAKNSRDVYVVAGNASEYVTVMQEHYRIIDLRHEQCCKMSERMYVKMSADNYRKLHDCLDCKGNGVLTHPAVEGAVNNATTTTDFVVQEETTTDVTVPTENATRITYDDEYTVEVEDPEIVKPTIELGGLLKLFN